MRAALTFRPRQISRIAPTSVPDYRAELAMSRVVAFSIPVFNSWFGSRNVAYTGDITLPIPGEVRVGGHAMAIVGCLDQPDKPEIGGGRFILRNSWGGAWGINSPHGAGYGTIPYAYIARFGAEAYSVS
jgi:C1A family cysteine protease